MFDFFDSGKLLIIGIVALIVIGPKELPRVLRQVGQAVGKMRRLASEFQGQFMEAMREADMADIKADMTKLAESAKVDVGFDPIYDMKTHMKDALEGSRTAATLPAETLALAAPQEEGIGALGTFEAKALSNGNAEAESSHAAAGVAPAVAREAAPSLGHDEAAGAAPPTAH